MLETRYPGMVDQND